LIGLDIHAWIPQVADPEQTSQAALW